MILGVESGNYLPNLLLRFRKGAIDERMRGLGRGWQRRGICQPAAKIVVVVQIQFQTRNACATNAVNNCQTQNQLILISLDRVTEVISYRRKHNRRGCKALLSVYNL